MSPPNDPSDPNDPFAPPPGTGRFHMDRAEEIMHAQERAEIDGAYTKKPAAATEARPEGGAPTAPSTQAPAYVPPAPHPAAQAARLATACAALLCAIAFFYPAIHDAIDRDDPIVSLSRSGRALAPPTIEVSLYLSIDSTPEGAEILVDGQRRGKTPAMINVSCVEGTRVRIELRAKGYRPYETEAPCEHGRMIDISPPLTRAR